MQNNNSFSVYRFAAVLSVALHLFFVTTVEAAVFLSKTFVPSFREPLITIETIRREHDLETTHSVRIERKKKPPGERERTRKLRAIRTSHVSSKNEVKTKSKSLDEKLPSLKGVFEDFQNFQTKMDKRIEKFRENLLGLAAHNQKSDSSDSVTSHVSDLEKVPIEVRKDLLPNYLKKMRFKIATEWLRQIRNLHFESEVATVRYQISEDGTISNLESQSSEDSELFLKSCLKTLEHASPFDPLPFQFQDSEREKYLTISLTFYLRKQNQETFFSLEHFRP